MHMFKLKYHVQLFFIASCVLLCFLQRNPGAFSYGDGVRIVQHLFSHLLKILMNMRAIGRLIKACITVDSRRAIRQIRLLGNQTDYVHTETVYPFIQPPVHHIKHFLTHLRVIPV